MHLGILHHAHRALGEVGFYKLLWASTCGAVVIGSKSTNCRDKLNGSQARMHSTITITWKVIMSKGWPKDSHITKNCYKE